VVAISATGSALVHRLGAAIAAACRDRAVLPPGAASDAVLAIALPIAGAAAVAAVIAHLAQTRAVWLPRRRIAGAPAIEAGPLARSRRAVFDLAAAALLGAAAFGWLWLNAPRLAATVAISPHEALVARDDAPAPAPHATAPGAAPALAPQALVTSAAEPALASQTVEDAAALLRNLLAALVLAWSVLGVLDALVRRAGLRRALAMTPAEKREDDRLAGADPRWRARRTAVQRGLRPEDAVAGASLLLLGDDAGIAVAWDPLRRPVPVRTATGRGAAATQLLGLARRHRVPIHRDPVLAAALVDGDGPVPERHWPRLAEIVAAVRGRAPGRGS
jgi:flagellar biosynthesis protein FlhB